MKGSLALKGRHIRTMLCLALSGLAAEVAVTRGVAPGYLLSPPWGSADAPSGYSISEDALAVGREGPCEEKITESGEWGVWDTDNR